MNDKQTQPSDSSTPKVLDVHDGLAPLGAGDGAADLPKTVEPTSANEGVVPLEDTFEDLLASRAAQPQAPLPTQDEAPAQAQEQPPAPAESKMSAPVNEKQENSPAPQQNPPEQIPPKQTPPKQPGEEPTPAPKRSNRWKWALAILVLAFLITVGGWVPVEKIPLLRNLAYAMGFDKTETAQMSFLRALLTWTDKTIGLPGNWAGPQDEASAQAALHGGQGALADGNGAVPLDLNAMERAGGQTSLIDIKALNAMQLKKGYTPDGVRGAVQAPPGRAEADIGPAVVRSSNVNVQTEANQSQGDVFFGSDNAAINRNFKDGYDSSKTLAKIKNPHVAGGKPIDWLLNTTQQLMYTNGPLGGSNRQLDATRVGWGSGLAALGEQKPHKDLYHAWVTSRMSDRTPNTMVKKALVDVGFLGADMPTLASVAIGGGVQIDSVAFQEDQEAWKEYLEFERKCKESLGQEGEKITAILGRFEDTKNNVKKQYPKNCYEALKTADKKDFLRNIKTMKEQCQQVAKGYQVLENECKMTVSWGDCNEIEENTYSQLWDTKVDEKCNDLLQEKCQEWNSGVACTQEQLNQYKGSDQWAEAAKSKVIEPADVTDQLDTDGKNFATLLRGKKRGEFWVPEDMDEKGYSQQLENVKSTIGDNISNVLKK